MTSIDRPVLSRGRFAEMHIANDSRGKIMPRCGGHTMMILPQNTVYPKTFLFGVFKMCSIPYTSVLNRRDGGKGDWKSRLAGPFWATSEVHGMLAYVALLEWQYFTRLWNSKIPLAKRTVIKYSCRLQRYSLTYSKCHHIVGHEGIMKIIRCTLSA